MTPNVRLGPGSPLLTASGARRKLGPDESDIQIALVELLLGKFWQSPDGARQRGWGLTLKHPELLLLYAINPNKGGQRSKAARGKAKAMGLLADMPDLCVPTQRGPFAGLYVEMKRPGTYGSASQRQMAADLRAEGYAVVECQTVEEAAAAILGYLALPKPALDHVAMARAHQLLTPTRRARCPRRPPSCTP